MSVLSAAQSAAIRLIGTKPTTLFSTDQFPMELADLANSVAVENIANSYDWRSLTKLATYTGDGAATSFALPADYDRMPKIAELHSKTWKTAKYRAAKDLDEWLFINDTLLNGTPGNWILLGGQMQIFPAMPVGETARHYYISNRIVSGGQTSFVADADTFLLPERLLTLGLIWRWRSQKRMEYAEDLQNFEIAKSEEITKDRGRRILISGAQRVSTGAGIAYPGVLGH